MWTIDSNNKISLTRGDTPTFILNLMDEGGSPYVPEEGDEIVFVIKKSANLAQIWAQITIPLETLELRFTESTTRALDFGEYVYEISLNNETQDYHDTFIPATPIIIMEELYDG